MKRLRTLLLIEIVLDILSVMLRHQQLDIASNIAWILAAAVLLAFFVQISCLLHPCNQYGQMLESPLAYHERTLFGRILPWGTPFPLIGGESDPTAWDENESLPHPSWDNFSE